MAKNKTLTLDDLAEEASLYANPASEKQAAILRAAEKLFGERGFDETPTAYIAREAGVTERTLFKHFPNKDSLMKRVLFPVLLKLFIPTQIRHMKNLIRNSSGSPKEFFENVFNDRLAFAGAHQAQLKFMLRQLAKDDELRDQVAELWIGELFDTGVDAVKGMQKNGTVRGDLDARIIARTMVSTIVSYMLMRYILVPKAKWNDDVQAQQMKTILLEGIQPR